MYLGTFRLFLSLTGRPAVRG